MLINLETSLIWLVTAQCLLGVNLVVTNLMPYSCVIRWQLPVVTVSFIHDCVQLLVAVTIPLLCDTVGCASCWPQL